MGLSWFHQEKDLPYKTLKPEKVVFDEDGYAALIDYGSIMVDPHQEIDYLFYETPEYLAPEIIDGEMPSKSADFWSFGVLIY